MPQLVTHREHVCSVFSLLSPSLCVISPLFSAANTIHTAISLSLSVCLSVFLMSLCDTEGVCSPYFILLKASVLATLL